MIKVNVKFFSLYSDVVKESTLTMDRELTVREIVGVVLEKFPRLRGLFDEVKPVILVNGRSVDENHVLKDGDEVAFLPPSSGG